MEGQTSSWGSRNRITCLTLQEHDDDDDIHLRCVGWNKCCLFRGKKYEFLSVTSSDERWCLDGCVCLCQGTRRTFHQFFLFLMFHNDIFSASNNLTCPESVGLERKLNEMARKLWKDSNVYSCSEVALRKMSFHRISFSILYKKNEHCKYIFFSKTGEMYPGNSKTIGTGRTH